MEQTNNEERKGSVCPICPGPKSALDCGCGYGHMHIHRHFWLRLILALIVAVIVFYVGVKVGEMKNLVSGHGIGYHRNSGYMMQGRGYSPMYGGMMQRGTSYGTSGSSGAPTIAPTSGTPASK